MSGAFTARAGFCRAAVSITMALAAVSLGSAAQADTAPATRNTTAAPAPAAKPQPRPMPDNLRLATIGYRLVTANADRCVKPAMATGLLLHDIASYAPAARPQITRAYGMTTGFGILGVVAGSAAERAGLRTGDEIMAVNGTDLAVFAADDIGAGASSDRSERFVDMLDAALQKGRAELTVRRGGATQVLSLSGDKSCGGRFVVVNDSELNAWTDGYYIAVTTKMMQFTPNDDELSFVIAHEMAHNLLDHTHPERSANIARGKTAEMQADALAVELLARSGSDLTAPERFLRRSARMELFNLHLSHPGNSKRIQGVLASVDRLPKASAAAAPMLLQASGGDAVAPMRLTPYFGDEAEAGLPGAGEHPIV